MGLKGQFISHSSYTVNGRQCFSITNPTTTERSDLGRQWHGKEVLIDGKRYRVVGVESYCIITIREGMTIGLMVEECQENIVSAGP